MRTAAAGKLEERAVIFRWEIAPSRPVRGAGRAALAACFRRLFGLPAYAQRSACIPWRRPKAARVLLWLAAAVCVAALSQTLPQQPGGQAELHKDQQQRSRLFLRRRGVAPGARPSAPAADLMQARLEHAAMVRASDASQPANSAWRPVGPLQVMTSGWNLVTGRISSLAADPSDGTGNTLYVGATGGGVWKSTNAAGAPGAVAFTPLTDDLGVFSGAAAASLSIGAVTVQPGGTGVVLAGTGDPDDATDSWYGSGLLRSADGGNTWNLIDQTAAGGGMIYNFDGNAFAGFAWSTANPNLVVAAISQSEYNAILGISNQQSILGLYYSTDAGATWQMVTIEDGSSIVQSPQAIVTLGNAATAVVWNPVRQRFYAAIRYHGYYESSDGVAFTRLQHQPGTNLTAAMCPTDSYVPGSPACPMFRGALAVQPVTGDMFALTVDENNLDQGLWQDACHLSGGACASGTVQFGSQIADSALESLQGDGTIPEGLYTLALAAVPAQQDTLLFAGTTDVWRCSLANSCQWRNTTNTQTCAAAQVAPEQHAIEATFAASGLLYFGNDGGVWRSTDAVGQQQPACSADDAAHFQNLNGGVGSLAEVESFSEDPSNSATWLAALGALGTAAPSSTSGAPWNQVLNGEGNFVAIDSANPQNWYATSEFGVGINDCSAGTLCDPADFGNVAVGEAQVDNDLQLIPAPWILDPSNTADLILGTCRVWRGAASGEGWSDSNLLSGILDGERDAFCNGNAEIRTLAAGMNALGGSGAEQLYVGMAGSVDGGGLLAGHVLTAAVNPQSQAATTSWVDLSASPVMNDGSLGQFNPGGFDVSSIFVDPHDASAQTIYVTIQGYLASPNRQPILYGSTDGGAHWSDLTSNLSMRPHAPANSVVVDPNNADIVYIALDTGVFYTQNIAGCAIPGNACWNAYGTGLPNAPVTSLMTFNEGATSLLRAATYGRGIWQIDLMTAGTARTTASADPATLSFAGQLIATSSAAETVTLTDAGPLNLNISSVSITGEFTESDGCSGQVLAPQASCEIDVTFNPTDTGPLTGALTIVANVSGGQVSVPLSGTGLAPPNLALTPSSLTFPLTTVGATSAAQTVTISNSGGMPVALTSESVSGDFSISNNTCTTSLAGQGNCEVDIVFSPTTTGTRTGTLSVVNALPTQIAQLTGTAQTVATDVLSPLSLTFANQEVGTTSAAQTVTLTNNGDQTLTGIVGAVSASFTLTNNCGAILAGHSSCSMLVAFAPTAAGAAQGALQVTDEFRMQTVALSGSALAAPQVSVSPPNLGFGSITINTTSAVQIVNVTNTGGYALASFSAAVTTGFTITSNNCPSTLALTSSCQIGVAFSPASAASFAGSLTLTASNLPSAAAILLTGTGLAPGNIVTAPLAVTFPATLIGSTAAAQLVSVTNSGGSPVALSSESVTGDFAIATNTCGASLPAQAECQIALAFTPTVSGTRAGTLSIVDSLGTQTVPVSGTGQTAATDTLSAASLAFGNQQVGTSSSPQTVTLTNSGDQSLTGIAVAVSSGFTLTNNCAASLAGHAACSMFVAYAPASTGADAGTLQIVDEFRTQNVSLTGTGLAPPQLSASPLSMAFGSVTINTSSATQTVTVTNTGGYALASVSAAVTAGFSIASNNCPATLALGSSCQIGIAFAPAAAGDFSGSLTLAASNLPASTVVALAGTGLAPGNIVITPSALVFPATLLGVSAAAQDVTVSNSGGSTVALTSESVTGDFTISSNNCGASLAAQASCAMAIVFTPAASGARSGTLSVVDSLGTQTAPVSGTGQTAANDNLSSTSLAFGNQQVGTTSAAQKVTLANTGDQTLTGIAVAVTGDFALTNNCGATLAGHATCSMLAAFAPTVTGTESGALQVTDELRSQNVSLTGTGLAPPQIAVSPASLSFGNVTTSTTSGAQTVTVNNTGGYPIINLAALVSAGFGIASNTCTASLAVGSSCQIGIDFAPAAAGPITGSLTLFAPNLSSASSVGLSGNGVTPGDIGIAPVAVNFPPTLIGSTATAQSVVVSNSGGSPVALTSESVSGDFSISSNSCGASLAAQASCQIAIVFTPTASGTRSATLSIVDSLGTQTIPVSGTGQAEATDTLSTTSLAFGDQQVGTISATQVVTLANTGDLSLSGIAVQAAGGFTLTNYCGASLAGHTTCSMLLAFAPSATGTASGMLQVSDEFRTQSISLSGTGLAPPEISASPTSLSFGNVTVSAASRAQTVAVTNVGGFPIYNLAVFVTAGFGITANNCPSPLTTGSSCHIAIDFVPTAAGPATGSLTLSASNLTAAPSVALAGTGLTPGNIVLTPTSPTFAPATVGTMTLAQSIDVANTGGTPVAITSEAVSGDFVISANTCSSSLAGQTSCEVVIVFKPSEAGTRTGVFTLIDGPGTQTATLTGTGQTGATDALSPGSLSFAPQQEGTASATQAVTLTNNGDETLTELTITATGDFALLNACGGSLQGHASCSILVAYTPTMTGSETGTLTVRDEFRLQTVALSGSGVAPPGISATPGSIDFGGLAVGTTSSAQTVTVSNSGGYDLTGLAASVTAGFAIASNSCLSTLPVGTSCALGITFSPSAAGAATGTLTLAATNLGKPLVVALSGAGDDFTITVAGSSSSVITSGQTASFGLLLAGVSGTAGTLTLTCSGAPKNSVCAVNPASVGLSADASSNATLSLATDVAPATSHLAPLSWKVAGPMFALLAPLAALGWRRRRIAGLAVMLLAILLLIPAGCGVAASGGGGGGEGGGGQNGTPPGTYTLTVTATLSNIVHSATVTVTVQ